MGYSGGIGRSLGPNSWISRANPVLRGPSGANQPGAFGADVAIKEQGRFLYVGKIVKIAKIAKLDIWCKIAIISISY
jgi:hypothetical protein